MPEPEARPAADHDVNQFVRQMPIDLKKRARAHSKRVALSYK